MDRDSRCRSPGGRYQRIRFTPRRQSHWTPFHHRLFDPPRSKVNHVLPIAMLIRRLIPSSLLHHLAGYHTQPTDHPTHVRQKNLSTQLPSHTPTDRASRECHGLQTMGLDQVLWSRPLPVSRANTLPVLAPATERLHTSTMVRISIITCRISAQPETPIQCRTLLDLSRTTGLSGIRRIRALRVPTDKVVQRCHHPLSRVRVVVMALTRLRLCGTTIQPLIIVSCRRSRLHTRHASNGIKLINRTDTHYSALLILAITRLMEKVKTIFLLRRTPLPVRFHLRHPHIAIATLS